MASVALRRRRRRTAVLTGCGAAVLAVAATGWVGAQAWQAAEELAAVVPLADELGSAVSARDFDAAREVAGRFRTHADRAHELTAGPLWPVFEAVPGLGPNLAAVRTVSQQLAVVAGSVVEPVLDAAGSLEARRDPLALAGASAPLAEASAAMVSARDAVDAVDAGALVPPLADGVARVQGALATGTGVVEGFAQAGAIVPGLLGAGGPREILVMLQNTAEVRTGGGITGSFVQLHAEDGEITLVRQAESGAFTPRDAAIAPVPDAATALYGDVVGRFVQNATMTPDFTASARLASAWWHSAYGVTPDAVVAIDPLVLRALLAAHGPVALPDGTQLSADDLVHRLLVEPYLHLDPEGQTAYLQQVSAAVLPALTADADPLAWLPALAPVIAEGRVSVWSAVPAEQETLAASALGGPRARLDAAGDGAWAVYFNDATGGKMGSYLDAAVEVEVRSCDDGPGEAIVRVELANTAPADTVSDLPLSMTGGGLWGTAVGDIGTNVTVAAPPGVDPAGVTGMKGGEPAAESLDGGRSFTAVRVNVSPGEAEAVEFRFLVPGGDAGTPVVLHTPMLGPVPVQVVTAPACAG
ncbi:DUF4012 domain-containing protein [Microbacterium lushaniae]|nr:DUF4012 domain-containing protein [Microbacterium lushaniae]